MFLHSSLLLLAHQSRWVNYCVQAYLAHSFSILVDSLINHNMLTNNLKSCSVRKSVQKTIFLHLTYKIKKSSYILHEKVHLVK